MKDLIILAMGDSKGDCPFDAEVWSVNNGYRQVMAYNYEREVAKQKIAELEKLLETTTDLTERFTLGYWKDRSIEALTAPPGRIDKIFIAHKGQEYDPFGDAVFDFGEINELVEQGMQIVSLFKVKEISKVTRLPFRAMVKKFETEYFSDSISYMLAYAIHINTRKVWNPRLGKSLLRLNEPMRIRMYGVDMHTQDEYATERGGIEYFIGVARTLGIEVWLHPFSAVCRTTTGKPYGFISYKVEDYDPEHILQQQRTVRGLKKLLQLGKIDQERFESMKKTLEEIDAQNKVQITSQETSQVNK